MRIRKRRRVEPDQCVELEQQNRLVDAEKRVNVLFEKAEWLHATVTRRDKENGWQDSVNRLFQGGPP